MGLPGCAPVAKAITKLIFVNLVDDTGVLTKIDPANNNNKAWFVALQNNADKSKRFQLTPTIRNIDTPKGEATFETFEDKSMNFIIEDVRKFKGVLPTTPGKYKGKLESVRCQTGNVGVYEIDLEGNVLGLNFGNDGYLYPKPIDAQSLVATYAAGNYKNTSGITLEFNYAVFIQDATFQMITANNFPDFSFNSIGGVVDVDLSIATPGTTTVLVLDLFTVYGALDAKAPVTGLATANFTSPNTGATGKVFDITSGVDHVITSAVESLTVPGRYTITLTVATTTLDNVSVGLSKSGFDGTLMSQHVIPTT